MMMYQSRLLSNGGSGLFQRIAVGDVFKMSMGRMALSTTRVNQASAVSKATQLNKKAIEAEKKRLNSLKSKLAKEKKVFSSLQAKFRSETKRLKDKERKKLQQAKAKEKAAKEKKNEKKVLAEATKPYRRLSAFNYYIKENASSQKSLKDATSEWKSLSDHEKSSYQSKADAFNEKQLQLYKPKPKQAANGFAAYVRANYYNDGRPIGEITKELAGKWKALADSEKEKFKASKEEKEGYARKLKQWTEERLRLYKESKSQA